MYKSKEYRTYSQIFKLEFQKWIKKEKFLGYIFGIAFIYSLLSNIISRCCPIECSEGIANFGNAIDEFLRNICYSILAGIIFYVINDVYKNILKRITETDRMFYVLLTLLTDVKRVLSTLSDNKYEKGMSREQTFQCIMNYLFNEKVDYRIIGSVSKLRRIRIEDCDFIVEMWRDFCKKQNDIVGVYGDLLEREEIYRLKNFDDNLVENVISYLDTQVERIIDEEFIEISDYDINIVVNRIIYYKEYLIDLAKKYRNYAYKIVYLNRVPTKEDIE